MKRLAESPLLIEYLIQSGAFIFPALVDTLQVVLSQRSLYFVPLLPNIVCTLAVDYSIFFKLLLDHHLHPM